MRKLIVLSWSLLILSAAAVAQETDRNSPVPLPADVQEKCLRVLRAGLASDEFWPAMHSAEALTLAGKGEEVRAALKPRLPKEEDDQKRCGLAREIARTGDRSTLGAMWKILADEKSNGRVHAAESLYKVAELGDGKVMRSAFANSDNPKLQMMAAAALARGGSPAAYQLLRERLHDPDRDIRKICGWVLGLLGDQRDIAPLQKVLAAETDPLAKAYFVNGLACLRDPGGRAAIIKNLSDNDPAIRTYSADFAGYARAVEAQPRLIEMLDDTTLDVRVRAAQSLIAFSLPPAALKVPIAVVSDDIKVDVYQATKGKPRYSEGSIIPLQDDSLLYATTEFVGGGADHTSATIVGRVSNDGGRTWGEQRTLQENIGKQNVMSVTLRRLPGEDHQPSDLLGMFVLVKNSSADLFPILRISNNDGSTFGEPIRVTSEQQPGYHVMNNDRVTITSKGRMICPIATTEDVFKKSGSHFTCFCQLSDDGGKTWRPSADRVDQPKRGAMEPEVVELADGKLLMIVRTQLGYIGTSTSTDGGDHWSEPAKLSVPAPEAPATIRTIPSTGDLLLVWNNNFVAGQGHGGKRTPLSTAISSDGGKTWTNTRNLESDSDQGFAYTSVLFHKDRVLLSYYVGKIGAGPLSSRFRSLPVRWLYEKP
ncbi:HEAT repeat protein [Anatilimnocola aggregata]|uniref:HEAT repeat protein n=1 Tax=Anatilimnocola aggregata TaxID=2528021 RepID=A0A517YMT4_9BACT|nr:exo-alpha-sialidase [Anatilimnocola aggregata]QDU31527.1 HEAT repeat protein [Anatilimnocola aggregata]